MEETLAPIQVEIKPGNPPTTKVEDQYYLRLSKSKGEHVEWFMANNNDDWAVVFQDMSPFQRDYFVAGKRASGTIIVDDGPTEYKYTICANGKKSDSPIIKIEP